MKIIFYSAHALTKISADYYKLKLINSPDRLGVLLSIKHVLKLVTKRRWEEQCEN